MLQQNPAWFDSLIVVLRFKANHVFDYLGVTRYYNGLVLLLEEDHYVVKDFIPVLRQMYQLRHR